MHLKRTWLVAILAAIVLPSICVAQVVYIPMTSLPGDGTTLQLSIANHDEVTRVFIGLVLEEGSDGTLQEGEPFGPIAVGAGETRVVMGPPGIGLLQFQGSPLLRVSARLKTADGSTQVRGAQVPVIDVTNLIPAGIPTEVASLMSSPDFLGDFGLINLGGAETVCNAAGYASDGTQLGPSFGLLVSPLSFDFFPNVPGGLAGGSPVSDVRIEISCDQNYFVFGRTVGLAPGYVGFNTPSSSLEDALWAISSFGPGRGPRLLSVTPIDDGAQDDSGDSPSTLGSLSPTRHRSPSRSDALRQSPVGKRPSPLSAPPPIGSAPPATALKARPHVGG